MAEPVKTTRSYNSPRRREQAWFLLVGRRGWTPEQFEEWFADATCSQLLAAAQR